MEIRRNAITQLDTWHRSPRRRPLIVRGARQVGKSTLVRLWAQDRSLSLAEINLEQHRELNKVFGTLEPTAILRELESTARTSLRPNTVLFLDEIQSTPLALPALRYLYEHRPEIAVIAAGSLLETVLQHHDFSMPVGRVEYLHLGPLSFYEFLSAVGDQDLRDQCEAWRPQHPWSNATHNQLTARQREYMLIGGMPEAIACLAAGEGYETARAIQRSILSTYRDDFAKYPTGNSTKQFARLQQVFDFVPTNLGCKMKYTQVSRDERARDLRHAVDLLAQARVVWRVHHSDSRGVPLEADLSPHTYKCLFLDVGLAAHVCGVRWTHLRRQDQRSLVNEGGLAEQYVGQHLLFRKEGLETPSLCYWLREGKSTNAEVDYVIDVGPHVVAIEVKAGKAGTLRSLHQFLARNIKSHPKLAARFDLNPPSLNDQEHTLGSGKVVKYQLLSLPLYMVESANHQLETLLEERGGE